MTRVQHLYFYVLDQALVNTQVKYIQYKLYIWDSVSQSKNCFSTVSDQSGREIYQRDTSLSYAMTGVGIYFLFNLLLNVGIGKG